AAGDPGPADAGGVGLLRLLDVAVDEVVVAGVAGDAEAAEPVAGVELRVNVPGSGQAFGEVGAGHGYGPRRRVLGDDAHVEAKAVVVVDRDDGDAGEAGEAAGRHGVEGEEELGDAPVGGVVLGGTVVACGAAELGELHPVTGPAGLHRVVLVADVGLADV